MPKGKVLNEKVLLGKKNGQGKRIRKQKMVEKIKEVLEK